MRWIACLVALVSLIGQARAQEDAVARRNVILITLDDCGPDFGCYGNALVATPNIDALAAGGQRFTRCFATSPVCSPSRSTLITGRFAPQIGSHQHRSDVPLPAGVQTMPALFGAAGWRATWLPWQRQTPEQFAAGLPVEEGRFAAVAAHDKTDYNFARAAQARMFDAWDAAAEGPFFAMIDFNSMKTPARPAHRLAEVRGDQVDPAAVEVLPYWPDTPEVRAGVARYHEGIAMLDAEIGRLLGWLDRRGLREQTLIVVWGDHGPAQLRAKQWCYDRGLHVPLLIHGPGVTPAVREELVSTIDLLPTLLAWGGVPVPAGLPGQDLLADDFREPEFVYATRDRCDETEDCVRAIRSRRFKFIHNLRPELPRLGRNEYTLASFPEEQPLLALAAPNGFQQLLLTTPRPDYELYDLEADPLELNNLISSADDYYSSVAFTVPWHFAAHPVDPAPNGPDLEPLLHMVPDKVREQVSQQRWVSGADAKLPRVLILGDSISIGYTPFVREQLAGAAVVRHNPGNGGATTRGLARLDEWLAEGPFDVVLCNWGLHDLAWRPKDRQDSGLDLAGELSTTLEDYEQNLDALLGRLVARGKPVLFASTTPVPAGAAGRRPEDPERYNAVAARLCERHGVTVVDLFARAGERPELQLRRNVHFSPAGSQHLAITVAEALRAVLPARDR